MAAWSARQWADTVEPVVRDDEKSYRRRLGSVIVQLRGIRGLSQAKLAERLHRSEAALSRWETGKATPSAIDLVRMADVFELAGDQADLLIYPPDRPISPVAARLARFVEAGASAGRAPGAPPRAGRGAA